MKSLSAFLIAAIVGTPVAAAANMVTPQPRSANTCADPNLASPFIEIFSPTRTAHGVRGKMAMVAYNSVVGTTDNFQLQDPVFLAWLTPQTFTTAFHQLITPSGNDIIYLPEVNGNPPTASGFTDQGVVGYAYSTQVCGSVPLLAASNAATSDHYWTTNQADHATLLTKSGWIDAGVPFFVLPLNCSCPA